MKPHSDIKTDLFTDELKRKQIGTLAVPLTEIGSCIDFEVLVAEVDWVTPSPVSPKGDSPQYPTESTVLILVWKRQ